MAVKSEVIKARIKVKYPNVNLSSKRLDVLADKLKEQPADDANEETVDQVLENFNMVFSFEDIAKEDDRLRNLEAKLDKTKTPEQIKQQLADEAAEKQRLADEDKAKGDAPDWATKMFGGIEDTVNTLKQEITDLKNGKATESKFQNASKLFDISESLKELSPDIKKSWIARVDVNSETPIEDQVKNLETEYTTLVQTNANKQELAGAPQRSFTSTAPSESDVENVVDGM